MEIHQHIILPHVYSDQTDTPSIKPSYRSTSVCMIKCGRHAKSSSYSSKPLGVCTLESLVHVYSVYRGLLGPVCSTCGYH